MKQCSVTGLLDSGLSKDEVDVVGLLRDMDASSKDLDNQDFSVDWVGSFRRIRAAYSEELDISFLLIQRCKTVCASLN